MNIEWQEIKEKYPKAWNKFMYIDNSYYTDIEEVKIRNNNLKIKRKNK